MRTLVIATHNRDKFREMKEALAGIPWEIVPAFQFPDIPEVVEDGQTLEENSLKKAREISLFTGSAALADDTGLFVDALGGRPGVFAARFAGEKCTYEDNVRKLLKLMENTPPGGRRALFRTVVSVYYPDRPSRHVAGEVEGAITEAPRGGEGFGYDPVFQPKGFSKVFAEMSLEEKNAISHRGKAVREARRLLQEP